mgnify:CR=1 FL=1
MDVYEEKKFSEMHQTVLDDDGIPQLMENLRQIKFQVDELYGNTHVKSIRDYDYRGQAVSKMLDEQTRVKDGVEKLQRKGFGRGTSSKEQASDKEEKNTGTAGNAEPSIE